MKSRFFWKRVSNYSAAAALVLYITLTYFQKYILNFLIFVIILCAITTCVFLIAEIMKFIIKKDEDASK